MARVSVVGVMSERSLPVSQVIILGPASRLSALSYQSVQSKFGGLVSEPLFQSAKELSGESVVNLYLNYCQLVGLSGKYSRHSCPAQPHTVTKQIRGLTGRRSSVAVVLLSPSRHLLPTVAAIARAFPLFSRKTKSSDQDPQDVSIELLLPEDEEALSDDDLKFLNSIVQSVRTTARLVDTPCNELNTESMIEEAENVAKDLGNSVTTTIIKGEELREKGFGGIYHVGKAARYPPALVVLSHSPASATKSFALVGKGIVYDTGGMQIKSKTGMPGMKRDMGGAAAVLEGFWTAVRSGFSQTLHAVLCLAENMISPDANKPDDIITMLSGKSVEINNTDAEGRLVLGDGVFYACSVLKANVIMDMATLTGAQLTATGAYHGGLVTNSDQWEGKAVSAGRVSGDLVHPLPFAPDLHFELLASSLADMKNSSLGKPDAGSAVASLFIAAQIEFSSTAWIHVDLAAPVHQGERATGYGPPLICALLASHIPVPLLHRSIRDFDKESTPTDAGHA